MKHYNIPVFVPHYGCPFSCVFCNQKEITGQASVADIESAKASIDSHIKTIDTESDIEIAFFGGSFTAIPREIMLQYLELGYKYILSGNVKGIRISTRPDFIDEEVLSILKNYKVTTIELGAQSFDDGVLKASGRGHTSAHTKSASKLIKQAGFELGIQLMTGLCGDTEEKSVFSASEAAKLKPDCVRIYPTLVIKDTKLYDLYLNGSYKPQTLDEAVTTVGKMLNIFNEHSINVIRVGLASVSEMNSRGSVAAGPDHPALRELCESQAYFEKMEEFLKKNKCKTIAVHSPASEFSKISGHKRTNKTRLKTRFGVNLKLVLSDRFFITSE